MKKKNILIIVVFSIFLAGTFYLDDKYAFGINEKIGGAVKPVGLVFSDIGSNVSGFFSNILNIGSLSKENQELRDRLDQARADLAKLQEAKKENQALKEDLNFKEESGFEVVVAKVIFFDPSNIRETITINAGIEDGIREGSVVLSQGYLVGKAISVGENTAKIKLITDPDSAIPATMEKINVAGIVKGKIGSGLVLDQIPQSDKVNIGDLVLTSGIGGSYPKGLIIGQVDNIQKISGSIFQRIELRPMVNYDRLERVMVIKG